MPKQIFQRPAVIKHGKMGAQKGGFGSAPEWGRKKGIKPSKKVVSSEKQEDPKKS